MKASKKLFLHIGFGKTGTSAIQEMMFFNRFKFSKAGLLYPEIGLYDFAHHHLSNTLGQKDNTIGVKKLLLQIKNLFAKSDYSDLLISSEQLCFSKPKVVELYWEIFNELDVKIIMYIRRQDNLIESTFLEWVKSGWDYNSDIENFFYRNQLGFDFRERIKAWVELFGRDCIEIHLYDKRLFTDVCSHFLNLIGYNNIDDVTFFHSNTSLLPEFYELVHKIDKAKVDATDRQKIIEKLLELSLIFKGSSSYTLINNELREKIYETYIESNRGLVKDAFLSDENKLFLKPILSS